MTSETYSSLSSSSSQNNILSAWRERIFYAIFLTITIIAVVPYISSSLQVIQEKRWANLVIYTLGYLCVIIIVLVRRIPFSIRVILGLATFYLLGLTALITIGPPGSGRVWLFAFSILASLLLGLRAGLISLILNAGTLFILGYLLAKGQLEWASEILYPIKTWIAISITFTSLNTVVTISLAVLVRALEQNLLQEQKLTMELTTTNNQLELDRKERRRISDALTQSEKKLSQAIQGNSIPTFIIDHNHIITHWNNACENLTGFSEAEMVGTKKHWTVFYPEERPILVDLIVDRATEKEIQSQYGRKIKRSILIKGAYEGENFFPDFGQKGKWLYFTSAPLRDQGGTIIGAMGTIQDITGRRDTEAQLIQAQKMESVGRLAGGVAHDYNNALSVIMGFTELAMIDVDPTGKLHAHLNQILTAGRRAADITRQLLAFARKQTISPILLDLNNNVVSMLKMLRRLLGEDIDLVWLPGTGLGNVKMDPSQIDQILANLCVNARDAIEGVGRITIETDTKIFDEAYCADNPGFVPGEFVLLSVSDNGCGMDKEILNNIFEPFFTTKDVDKGTGLGLAMVYGIVKQNNGFINIYSEPDKGTTIKIYLPGQKAKTVDMGEESIIEVLPGRGETILLVEDDLPILQLTETILSGLGYAVLAAGTPGEALKLAREYADDIHLLLTDVIMPEMNGRELAERLQSFNPNLLWMFMSGYTANAIAHHGVLDKGVHFIQKPFSKKDLAKIVRKALDEEKNCVKKPL
jgi:signal transduction histidine kinase/CheY-like chemotaxis protein